MPFTFNRGDLYVVTINGNLWSCTREKCRAMWYKKQPDRLSENTVVAKTFGININWW